MTEPPIAPFSVGASAASTATRLPASQDLAEELRRSPLRMDRKTHTRMTRGRIEPQSRIDLHGMTLARAHPVLVRFILSAQAKGHRLVLVITGKGRDSRDNGPIPERRGLLRHQVPEWLWAPPLDSAVQQIAPAHRRHGGSGAYYVWLRRR
ncbi:Smr/MutS family protein [Roseitranquillus sediminis]|uniref:Smr/MutS family protein n=1 Tax=Roseitranquillus sediminis TaxID=2809051 RepID=UPI0029C9E7C5|nr:Smr/MutS family protein [Roseitranquillus sediminis]